MTGGITSEDTVQAGRSAASISARACEPRAMQRQDGGHLEAHRWAGLQGRGEQMEAREMDARRPRARGCEMPSERLTAATSGRVCRTE